MPFTREQQLALSQLAELWSERSFVLIGASALQVHLPLNRNTRDLDITLAADLDEFPAGLDNLEGWRQQPGRDHTWLGPNDVRVDVLPAGPGLRALGHVTWPSGATMSILGFRHVFRQTIELEVNQHVTIRVARPHIIAFLKMVAFLDRPLERGRDLSDIAFLLDAYVDDDDERRWSEQVTAADLDFEDVPSYLLGRDLSEVLDTAELAVVQRFVDTVRDEPVRSRLVRRAPTVWRRDADTVERRLAAFRLAMTTI